MRAMEAEAEAVAHFQSFSSPQTHLLPYNAVYCTVGKGVIADFDSK